MTETSATARSAGERRLLVLDDDALIGETVRRIAETVGFDVRLVTDAEPFLELLDAWQPSHIALDLRMPGMDGMEVIAELARRRCTATIVIASGVGDRVLAAAARSAREHGLVIGGVLAKPFTAAAFRSALVPAAGAGTLGRARAGDVALERPEELGAALLRALDRDDVGIALQPKVHCGTGAVAGFEALVRWRHRTWGVVPPATFLPVASRLGLMARVTEVVLDRTARWLLQERVRAAGEVTTAINVSAAIVTDGVPVDGGTMAFEDWADARCSALSIEPERVVFELTETDAMSDSLASLDSLTRLRMKGFHLSIDDFGTGYSSLARLARLPFSELKIDRSFVGGLVTSREAATIVRTAVDLAHGLGLVSVAEGVEDAATLRALRDLGCDLAQGFHVARPMSPGEASAWLAARDG